MAILSHVAGEIAKESLIFQSRTLLVAYRDFVLKGIQSFENLVRCNKYEVIYSIRIATLSQFISSLMNDTR